MITGPEGVTLVKKQESCVLHRYKDKFGFWTIGWGHRCGPDEGSWTQEKADDVLRLDLGRFERAINQAIKVPLTQSMFDALVSLCFNCGEGAVVGSTLGRLLNARAYLQAADEMLNWCHGPGHVVDKGLLARRNIERALFLRDPLP